MDRSPRSWAMDPPRSAISDAGVVVLDGPGGLDVAMAAAGGRRQAPDLVDQPLRLDAELLVGQAQHVPAQQGGERGRDVVGPRQLGALHQDRHDAHVALEGGLDLQPHEVVLLEQARAGAVGGAQPVGSDDRQQHVARLDGVADHLGEVEPERDRVDVHEDVGVAEGLGQPVVQPAGVGSRVVASVVDEHLRCSVGHRPTRLSHCRRPLVRDRDDTSTRLGRPTSAPRAAPGRVPTIGEMVTGTHVEGRPRWSTSRA